MKWRHIILYPFAILYDFITTTRNLLYKIGVFKTITFPDVKIISVGNLSVGGTGKTPFVEYLIENLVKKNYKIAVLSRGYGRTTKGVRIADSHDNALTLGDESFGYFCRFGAKIKVVVAEKRVLGVRKIMKCFPETNVIILDDAFQHLALYRNFDIVLTTYQNPFWRDYVMPSGLLREARNGYSRAHHVVLTKCDPLFNIPLPNLPKPLSCTTIGYENIVMMKGEKKEKMIVVAGLANPRIFFEYTQNHFEVLETFSYRDHYLYTQKEVKKWVKKAKKEKAMLLTTFKDLMKLRDFEELNQISWGYLPMRIQFIKGEQKFLDNLFHHIT